MKEPYFTLYKLAEPYLQTRDNTIHTKVSYSYSVILCKKEGGDKSIVYPAIILHDVGWIKVPAYLHNEAYGPDNRNLKLNRVHELEGSKIAKSLLKKINYPKQLIEEIASIVEGHDLRNFSLSLNDAIVKDSDKLWRYSYIGMSLGIKRFSLSPELYINYIEENLNDWLLTTTGKNFAYQELVNRKNEWSLTEE